MTCLPSASARGPPPPAVFMICKPLMIKDLPMTVEWHPGQPVSWASGASRRLVPATVRRDDGGAGVHLEVERADGASVRRKVPRDRVVGVGQGDLFADGLAHTARR